MNPTGWNIRGLELDLSFEIAPGTTPANGIFHIAPGTYSSVEISIRTLWNPEAHPLFTGLDNIDQRQRRITRTDRAFEGALYVRSGEGPASLYVARDDSGTEWEFRAKADGSMGVFSGNAEVATFNANGNLVMTEGKSATNLASSGALGVSRQNHGPDQNGGAALSVINSRAVTLSRWIMYRPAPIMIAIPVSVRVLGNSRNTR